MAIKAEQYRYGFDFTVISGAESFDARDTFECGQCFRWMPVKMDRKLAKDFADGEKDDGMLPPDGTTGYMVTAGGKCVEIFTAYEKAYILNCTVDEFKSFWYGYLDFGRDYGKIKEELSLIDSNMRESVKLSPGLRILKQEPFETLISFIVSANNNIPRIKKIIGSLSAMAGEKIDVPEYFKNDALQSNLIYAFPDAAALSEFDENAISERTHAGYRCGYIVKTVQKYLTSPIDYSTLKNSSYEEAFAYISGYTGVGPKVADCILLFTGIKDEAFPVDVWVKRVMMRLYSPEKDSVNAIRAFGRQYFGKMAGIAQEYLFVYVRTGNG